MKTNSHFTENKINTTTFYRKSAIDKVLKVIKNKIERSLESFFLILIKYLKGPERLGRIIYKPSKWDSIGGRLARKIEHHLLSKRSSGIFIYKRHNFKVIYISLFCIILLTTFYIPSKSSIDQQHSVKNTKNVNSLHQDFAMDLKVDRRDKSLNNFNAFNNSRKIDNKKNISNPSANSEYNNHHDLSIYDESNNIENSISNNNRKYIDVGAPAWMTDEDIENYNCNHIDDPMLGYGMTPKSVSEKYARLKKNKKKNESNSSISGNQNYNHLKNKTSTISNDYSNRNNIPGNNFKAHINRPSSQYKINNSAPQINTSTFSSKRQNRSNSAFSSGTRTSSRSNSSYRAKPAIRKRR